MADDKKSNYDNDDAYLDLLSEYSKNSKKAQEDNVDDLHDLISQKQKKPIGFSVHIDDLDSEINTKKAPQSPPAPPEKRKTVVYSPKAVAPETKSQNTAQKTSMFSKVKNKPAQNQPQRRIIRRPEDSSPADVYEAPVEAEIIRANKEKFDLKTIEKFLKENKSAWIIVLVCVVTAVLIASYTISCINDVLAINRDPEKVVTVTITSDANTKDVMKILKDNNLINHKYFCTVFAKIMKFRDDNYLAGIYYITPSMGVEKMLTTFKSAQTTGETVTLAFPEGFSVDQIAEKLEKYEVCKASEFYKTMQDIDFGEEYEFIKSMTNKNERYNYLEGYMYPDTYDFYVGENPAFVIRKFLDNFKAKWSSEYKAQAEKMNMTIDDAIRLASIVEKEAYGAEQMPKVSSVLHNRLNKSGLFPTLQCDATTAYINNFVAKRVTSSTELAALTSKYSTKKCVGLPIGAICNPGNDAIKAALFPDKTDYYFFLHDNSKKLYLARNDAEHQKNGLDALRANNAAQNQTTTTKPR